MNTVQECSCCLAEDICKYKEIYQAGVDNVLRAVIPTGRSIDDLGNSFYVLKDCPHIEVSIKCPHVISIQSPIHRGITTEDGE